MLLSVYIMKLLCLPIIGQLKPTTCIGQDIIKITISTKPRRNKHNSYKVGFVLNECGPEKQV